MNTYDKNISHRQTVARFISHLLVITMLFVLPELVMAFAMPHKHSIPGIPGFYIKSAVFVGVFYINYYYIISRTLAAEPVNIWRFIGLNSLVLVVGLLASHGIGEAFMRGDGPEERHHDAHEMYSIARFASQLIRDAVMIILTIALAVALRLSDKWKMLERRHREINAAQRATELDSLKSQLNPHFLFNTLNNIYALIAINPNTAQNAVHELSQLLRYVLYENPSEIELKRELEFVQHYVSLMKLRQGDRCVDISLNAGKYEDAKVAPMIFIALIENAFKHGNTGNTSDPIIIDIKADHDEVVCRTINKFNPSTRVDSAGGIGIANLRRRLQLIYEDKAQLSTQIEGDVYTSILRIPLL